MAFSPVTDLPYVSLFHRQLLMTTVVGLLSAVGVFAAIDVHDPEIVKQDDTYYIFSTGRRGMVLQTLRSNDLRTWERLEPIFPEVPEWVREAIPRCRGFWAPGVHSINGRYYLYYSASSFGSQRSLIGLATNVTLNPSDPNYRWADEGKVIESREGMAFNAIDAAIVTDAEGGVWMTFGSFWGGIMMIALNAETGKPFKEEPEVKTLARREANPNAIEAPYIIYRDGYYYLFVSFDSCCRGAESTYKIMVGRSKAVTGPYVDAEGNAMLKGGGTLVLEGDKRWKGPGHNSALNDGGTFYLVHHAYDAENRGRPALHIRPLTWTSEGWPRAEEPLEVTLLEGGFEPPPPFRPRPEQP